ncbi:hypothetical protein KY284_037299 [Solanum tuberosum]|nr:hypothetical protein KY284_037299 [Solanum tuberosum]
MDFLGKHLNDVLMILLEEEIWYYPPEENLEMLVFIKQLKIVQKKMKFLRYLYDTEINGYINHEKLECLETRIQFMMIQMRVRLTAMTHRSIISSINLHMYYA